MTSWYKMWITKRLEELLFQTRLQISRLKKKGVLKNGWSSSGKQDWSKFTSGKYDFINAAYTEEDYWKRAALESKNEEEKKQLTDLAPLKVLLAHKDAGKSSIENISEMLFYLKKYYSSHTEEWARIEDIPQDDRFSFEEMSDYLKTFSKSVIEVEENMTLKNKMLLGGWISTAAKGFRHNKMHGKNLPNRFEDRMFKECGIKKQTIYNYKNLYKLMVIAPKLFNCQVSMMYFVKNHDILFSYFQEIEEQALWKHNINCACQTCNWYFTEHAMTSWSCAK